MSFIIIKRIIWKKELKLSSIIEIFIVKISNVALYLLKLGIKTLLYFDFIGSSIPEEW